MKVLFNNKYIFLLFIFSFLIKLSCENEEKLLERYKNAIKLILSRANGIIKDFSLTFEYEKYNVTLNNIKILKPFYKNNNFSKKENDNGTFFIIDNIMTTIKGDIFIQLFSQKEEKIKYKPIFFEIYFKEIIFKLINKFRIEFSSLEIESFNSIHSKNLEYFRDFNNKIICIFYEGKKEPIILEDIYYDSKLKEVFQNQFEEKIKETQTKINLLTYDMIYIYNNNPFKIKTEDEYNYISYLEPKKIELDENDINLDFENNSISIKFFTLKGVYLYYLLLDTYYNFSVQCKKDIEHFKFKINNNNKVEMGLFLSDCTITDDNFDFDTYSIDYFDEIKNILNSHYMKYLRLKAEEYFKEIVDN